MPNPADEIIREAMEQGKFENLANKGKKLNLDDYFNTPEDLRMEYSVLKSADFIPKEVQLLNEISALKEQLPGLSDETQRKKLMKEIGEKQLEYDLIRERFKRSNRV